MRKKVSALKKKVKGVCSDCGNKLDKSEATLCEACKEARKKKRNKRMLKVALVTLAAIPIIKKFFGGISFSDWLTTASDEELKKKRDELQDEYRSAGLNNLSEEEFIALEDAINKIDDEISERDWNGKEPGYPVKKDWYRESED